MALYPTAVSDNPQQPMIFAETYIPDQLIAGNLKLISTSATVAAQSTAIMRGTIMGVQSESITVAAGKAAGTGTIVVAAVPTAGDTLTIGGTAITFNTLPSSTNELPPVNTQWILGTTALQAAALCAMLNSSTDANLSKNTYTVSASTITGISKTPGTAGNVVVTTSDSSAFTVATWTGGTANTGASTITLLSTGPNAIPGVYKIVVSSTSSTSALVITNPAGEVMTAGVMGTAYVSSEISFTPTDSTTTAADQYWVTVAAAANWRPCAVSNGDGSEIPAGILADYCDPTQGGASPSGVAVVSGIYLMGEFNLNAVILDPSLSLANVTNQLRPLGIFLKSVVSATDPQ